MTIEQHTDTERIPTEIPEGTLKEELGPYSTRTLEGVDLEAHQKFMASLAIPTGGQTKAETYSTMLAEQQRQGIEFVGFEGDPDFEDLPDTLISFFGQDLLDRCLVGKISYDRGHVLVVLPEDQRQIEIPVEKYSAIQRRHPEVEAHRVRAFNTSGMIATLAAKRYARMPIAMFSFTGISPDSYRYIQGDLTGAKKLQVFKLGTVVHEVSHNIFNYVMNSEDKEAWTSLNGGYEPVTDYSAAYVGKTFWDEEQFCEAVRLYATNNAHLAQEFPQIAAFIAEKFPSLRADSLLDVQ